jgi:hypothetical protein
MTKRQAWHCAALLALTVALVLDVLNGRAGGAALLGIVVGFGAAVMIFDARLKGIKK